MLSSSPQQSIGYPQIKATMMVKDMLEMLAIDFPDFYKCKTCTNDKGGNKIGTSLHNELGWNIIQNFLNYTEIL